MRVDKIIVCAPKGTPPYDPSTPAALVKCIQCGLDLVMDARNVPRMKREGLATMCADCAVIEAGTADIIRVQGMLDGKDCSVGVDEFLDSLFPGRDRVN